MALHLLFATPSTAAFADCLSALSREDSILLFGDGISAAIAESDALQRLVDTGAMIYALELHATVTGIAISPKVSSIDMAGFVKLTERCSTSLSWY